MNSRSKEIMSILQEECAEVIQAISKVNRFGIDEVFENRSNRERLEEEIGDVMCLMGLLIDDGIVDEKRIESAARNKLDRLKRWSTI